eukprot:TRINITY_DN4726_c0_g1_i1.p1 TRINITY_DN4726_c0_g1~~TRINITY_DN4726_c0_g1_i1.p1  ORF type:complete len:788 (+),score=91.43 TRINITY_DN4726_c0_g1_i1:3140-5503(+)
MAPSCSEQASSLLTFLSPCLLPSLQRHCSTPHPLRSRRSIYARQAHQRISPEIHRATALRKSGDLREALEVLHKALPLARHHAAYYRELFRTTAGLVAQSASVEAAERLWFALEAVLRDDYSHPDATSFNTLLSALRHLDAEKQRSQLSSQHEKLRVLRLASNVFDAMIDLNAHPDHFTMSILFNMCAFRASERFAALFEKKALDRFDYSHNTVSGTALLAAFAKSGSLEQVDRVINLLRHQKVVFNQHTYTTIITAHLRHGKHAHVLDYFDQAIQCPSVTPNVFLFSGALTSCLRVCDGVNGLRVFQMMREKQVRPTDAILNLMFQLALRSGDLRLGVNYITQWAAEYDLSCDLSHYNKVMSSWKKTRSNVSDTMQALHDLLQHMEKSANIKPEISTYNAAMTTLVAHGKTEEAVQVLERMLRRGLFPNIFTYNILLNAYGKAGNFDEALEVVRVMKKNHVGPDLTTYNSIMHILLNHGRTEEAQLLLDEIENNEQLEIDAAGRCTQLKLYRIQGNTRAALQLHYTTQKLNKPLDSKAYGLLLSILFEFDEREKAISLFGWLSWKRRLGFPVYNVMISNIGREENGCQHCFKLFQHMKERGIMPDRITYSTMIRVSSKSGLLDRAFRLLGEMQDLGLAMSDMHAWTSLMDGCRRCGQWQRAVELLEFMKKHSSESVHSLVPSPSTACYNAALYAAGIGGQDWKASLKIYESLLADKTQQPDFVTYSAMASIILRRRRRISEWHIVRQVCKALEDVLLQGKDSNNMSKPMRKKLLTKMSSLQHLLDP